MPQPDSRRNRDASTRNLAAGAGEDRAALSGHPRKADAGQYAIVLHQRPSTNPQCLTADPFPNSGFDNLSDFRPIRLTERHFELPTAGQW